MKITPQAVFASLSGLDRVLEVEQALGISVVAPVSECDSTHHVDDVLLGGCCVTRTLVCSLSAVCGDIS
jgi:hypothetical protein